MSLLVKFRVNAEIVVVCDICQFDNIQPFSFYEVFQLLPNPQGRGYYMYVSGLVFRDLLSESPSARLNQALRLIY